MTLFRFQNDIPLDIIYNTCIVVEYSIAVGSENAYIFHYCVPRHTLIRCYLKTLVPPPRNNYY